MRSALGPFAGNRSRPAHRGTPGTRCQPVCASPSAPARARSYPAARDRDGMGGHGHQVIGEVIAGQAAVALLFRGAVVMAGPLQRQLAGDSIDAERASGLSPCGATSSSIKASETVLGSTSATRAVRRAAGGCGTIAGLPSADLPLPWDLRLRPVPPAGSVRPVATACKGIFASVSRNEGGTVRLLPGR